ncbi:flagellar protein [Roseibium litorale]|uniref:Flagellar protein n=1 Tax=Roseibium litorale TaxID=2803841 RepID=A0ABR9CHX4_9HYPH|nr:flagellar protein [Roseibium litorale]MBD8890429.1 flagellar protein [Roseibium litorale]
MAVDQITTSRAYMTKQVASLSKTLQEKTAQLATGKVSNTYGGVGNSRLLDLELTQKVGRIEAYQDTIVTAELHIKSLNLTLERMEELRIDSKSAIDPNDFEMQSDGQTRSQATSEVLLFEAVSLLNTEVAGYYLFGGSDADKNPVSAVNAILDGADGKDGLRAVMSEYAAANLGPNNNGRMDVSALTTNYAGSIPTDSTFTVAEDGAHDFGFDISSVTNGLSNVAVTGPGGGDPDSFDISFTGQPTVGETISIALTLPPDHSEPVTIELTAKSNANTADSFTIGADLEETAANLRAAINTALEEQASTTLRAASDEWAGNQFFDTFGGTEPMRVDGPPFDTATGLVAGGSTTVSWYTGDNTATTNAREDKSAAIDQNLIINYGARANEQGLADVVKSLAIFVAADFTGGTDQDEIYYSQLATNLRGILQPSTTDQSGIVDISTEVSIAHRTLSATSDRHLQMKSSYQTTIDEIEGVDKELLAAEILQLQTNIEASYKASSIVYNLSLVNYL